MIKQLNQQTLSVKILQYGYWFLVSNLIFSISLLPASAVLMIEWNEKNLLLWVMLYVSLLPAGPAASALFGTMGKLMREGSISVGPDYLRALKENGKPAMILWSVQLLISLILLADITLVEGMNEIFRSALYVLLILNVIIIFYLYPLLSRFDISRMEAVRIAVGLTFLRIKNTLLIMSALAAWGICAYFFQLYAVTLLLSPLFYTIMTIHKGLFAEIEENTETQQNTQVVK